MAMAIEDFKTYQMYAKKTAVYPEAQTGSFQAVEYCTLGVNGEAGEVAEKVKKAWRDEGVITPERREKILDEAGDVLWYIAQLCTELNASMESIASGNIAKLQRRQSKNKLHGDGDKR